MYFNATCFRNQALTTTVAGTRPRGAERPWRRIRSRCRRARIRSCNPASLTARRPGGARCTRGHCAARTRTATVLRCSWGERDDYNQPALDLRVTCRRRRRLLRGMTECRSCRNPFSAGRSQPRWRSDCRSRPMARFARDANVLRDAHNGGRQFRCRRIPRRGAECVLRRPASRYFSFLLQNLDQFFQARQLFEDEASRVLFDQLILFRVMGHLHVAFHSTTPQTVRTPTRRSWWVIDTDDVSQLVHCRSIWCRDASAISGQGMERKRGVHVPLPQYYFSRATSRSRRSRRSGDRRRRLLRRHRARLRRRSGRRRTRHVFDPLPRHCAIMRQAVDMNPAAGAANIDPSVWPSDHVTDVAHCRRRRINPGARLAIPDPDAYIDESVTATACRASTSSRWTSREASWRRCRRGQSALRRWRPKLAISLYHRPEDFFSIPRGYIRSALGYRLLPRPPQHSSRGNGCSYATT